MSGDVFAWEHGLTVEGRRMPRLSYNKTHDFGRRGRDHGGVVDSRALVLATDYAALLAERDDARRTAEYWKAEHLAGNERIEALRANDARYRFLRNGGWEVLQDPKYWQPGLRFDGAIDAAQVDVAIDAAIAALTDQGRAGEGSR